MSNFVCAFQMSYFFSITKSNFNKKNPVGDHISPRKIPAEHGRAQPSFRWPVSVAIDALFGSNGWFCLLKSGKKHTQKKRLQLIGPLMIFTFNSIYVGSRSLLGHHSARWRHPGRISRWGPYAFVRNSEGCSPNLPGHHHGNIDVPLILLEHRWTAGESLSWRFSYY